MNKFWLWFLEQFWGGHTDTATPASGDKTTPVVIPPPPPPYQHPTDKPDKEVVNKIPADCDVLIMPVDGAPLAPTKYGE